MRLLHVCTLGAPEVRLGDYLVTFSTRKTLALLIYLAVEAGLQPREHLAALLWPESNPERSYANLRNTLGHLQAGLHPAGSPPQAAYLLISHHSLGLNPDTDIDLDLQLIEKAYAQARGDRSSRTLPEGSAGLPLLQLAAARSRGDFLVGFSLGDAPGFDDWAAAQREVWRRRLGLILDRLSEIQFAGGEFAGAAETAASWIALDTLNEGAFRRKMRAHFAAGERGQALETYETCRRLLAAELNVEPEPDTSALAERIRTQVFAQPAQLRRSGSQSQHPNTSTAFLERLFAGRQKELQTLAKSFALAADGRPQLVVLRGEAGIGKTRLAAKFLSWAASQGAEALHGSAFESGRHWPFQPLVEALRMRLEREDSPKDLLDEVWLSQLSQLLPELRRRYPDLAPAHPARAASEERPALEEGSPVQFFEPFTQLTLALAQRAPLVLFVDDLQWTDSATLDTLQYAIRRWREKGDRQAGAVRIMLLVSLRSDALQPTTQPQQAGGPPGLAQWVSGLERELAPVHLELEPLGEGETVQMALSILKPPDPDFAQWLYAETRGQPFYLMETLKDLLERRVLHPKRRADGQWSFTVDREHDLGSAARVPSTVHAVIRSRLNRLSPNAFSLLAGAAVYAKRITFEHLCAISSVIEDLALPALDELLSGRLLTEAAQPGAASDYALANDMLRDVVYTEAGDARRRLFHRRAMEILAAGGEPAAVLAYHAQAAGMAQADFHYSLAAGRDALALSASGEAIIHLERARHLLQDAAPVVQPDPADMQALSLGLSRAYRLAGRPEKAAEVDADRESKN